MNTATITPVGSDALRYANGELAFLLSSGVIASTPDHSTAISFWDYDPARRVLAVRYKSATTFYEYVGVPLSVVMEMLFFPSLGEFIAKRIKPTYEMGASYG